MRLSHDSAGFLLVLLCFVLSIYLPPIGLSSLFIPLGVLLFGWVIIFYGACKNKDWLVFIFLFALAIWSDFFTILHNGEFNSVGVYIRLVFYYFFAKSLSTSDSWARTLFVFFLANLIVGFFQAVGISFFDKVAMFYATESQASVLQDDSIGYLRVTGIAGNPNYFSLFSMCGAMLANHLHVGHRKWLWVVIFSSGVILGQSRTIVLFLIVYLLFFDFSIQRLCLVILTSSMLIWSQWEKLVEKMMYLLSFLNDSGFLWHSLTLRFDKLTSIFSRKSNGQLDFLFGLDKSGLSYDSFYSDLLVKFGALFSFVLIGYFAKLIYTSNYLQRWWVFCFLVAGVTIPFMFSFNAVMVSMIGYVAFSKREQCASH